MYEIGGYFEIEYSNMELGIHQNAIALNTARNCLEYILLSRGYNKVYLPYYTCDVLLGPLLKHNIEYAFYFIDESLEPISIPKIGPKEAFIYTNYFGLKGEYAKTLSRKVPNLIIDNSQALFEPPIENIDTFYSLRKFIGAPDGAFLYCSKQIDIDIKPALSFSRLSHLYKRKEVNAAFGYDDFKRNDQSLSALEIMYMSASTESLIRTYDFEKNKIKRERNFLYLDSKLKNDNAFKIEMDKLIGPFCYPFLGKKELKELMIKNRVYVPTFWPNIKEWINEEDCVEMQFSEALICLPIDQRYNLNDLFFICDIILK